MKKKLSSAQIRKMAEEIRKFFLDNDMWVDTRIYFNGKAFSTDDEYGYYYNDPNHLVVLEDQDPHKYVDYVGDVLTITSEGDFCGAMNNYCEYGSKWDWKIQEGFNDILKTYGCYAEEGHHWSWGVYYND